MKTTSALPIEWISIIAMYCIYSFHFQNRLVQQHSLVTQFTFHSLTQVLCNFFERFLHVKAFEPLIRSLKQLPLNTNSLKTVATTKLQ